MPSARARSDQGALLLEAVASHRLAFYKKSLDLMAGAAGGVPFRLKSLEL